ncbi:MAG: restriction endonuclease [Chloroflexi bacterium]|nr:restriction endonuclease [Chloroflexota bacterium]MCY4105933.1 restriction endonuclease [Chloroflexota bacterium]
MIDESETLFSRWKLTEEELSGIVDLNPSLMGMMLGYVAEYKLQQFLRANESVLSLIKPDDHDRRKGKKNDLSLEYKDRLFTFEVKSLQTNSIHYDHPMSTYTGRVQVDASDRRSVTFPNGSSIDTTCLLIGGFDILAVNLFQFRKEWDFGFIRNSDLPRTKYRKYTNYQRKHLLATTIQVTWPLSPPFVESPFDLMDSIISVSN